MSHQDFISVKKNPQYQIQFRDDKSGLQPITWIAVTKMLIKQNNEQEDAEKASDYLAMHVYPCNEPNQKITNPGHPLIKSTYTNEQTIMLRIADLDRATYIEKRQMLNLVLDQTKRKKDLFYKVEIYSSVDFGAQRVGKKYTYKQTVDVPTMPISGGSTSSPFFYKNPQYVVCLDPSKVIDK